MYIYTCLAFCNVYICTYRHMWQCVRCIYMHIYTYVACLWCMCTHMYTYVAVCDVHICTYIRMEQVVRCIYMHIYTYVAVCNVYICRFVWSRMTTHNRFIRDYKFMWDCSNAHISVRMLLCLCFCESIADFWERITAHCRFISVMHKCIENIYTPHNAIYVYMCIYIHHKHATYVYVCITNTHRTYQNTQTHMRLI